MPHRPAQPRIDPRRRRPDAFDQPAENDAVGLRQPRFQLAVDVQLRARRLPAAARCGRRTRSGTLPDSRRARPSGRLAPACRADRRTRTPAPIPAGLRSRRRRRAGRATARSATSRWRFASSAKSCGFDALRAFERRPAPSASAAISACADRVRSSLSRGPRLGTMQRGRLAAAELGELIAEAREIARQPAAAGLRPGAAQQRQFERLDRRRLKAPCAPPSRHSGCFSSASSVGGSSRFAAASAASRAKMPAGVSISASPPESSNSRFQRPSAAITRRASARSGVTSAADLFRCRASRIATAIASASISGLAASMTARLAMPREIFSAISGSASRRCHCAGRVRRPHRLGDQHFAPVRRRLAEDFDVAALDAESLAAARASRIADGSTPAAR